MIKKIVLRKLILEYLKQNPGTQLNSIIIGVGELVKKYDMFPTKEACEKVTTNFMYYADKRLNPIDEININEIIWDLIVERVLTVGADRANRDWPWLRITEFGKQIVDDENANYYDPEGYIDRIKSLISDLDSVIEQYSIEGLNCFKRRLFFASCVMFGAAAEKAVLILLEAIGQDSVDSQKKKSIKNLLDRQSLPSILREIQSTIDLLIKSKKIPYDIHQGATEHLLSLFEMIRVQRNESIHPEMVKINREKLLLFISSLPASLEVVYKLTHWFRENKI